MGLPISRKRLILIYLQLHVLSYTLHTLLDKMSESLLPGDLDSSLQGLVEVSCLYIFSFYEFPRRRLKMLVVLPMW